MCRLWRTNSQNRTRTMLVISVSLLWSSCHGLRNLKEEPNLTETGTMATLSDKRRKKTNKNPATSTSTQGQTKRHKGANGEKTVLKDREGCSGNDPTNDIFPLPGISCMSFSLVTSSFMIMTEKEGALQTVAVIETIMRRNRYPNKNEGNPITPESLLALMKKDLIQWEVQSMKKTTMFTALATDPMLCTPEILDHFWQKISYLATREDALKYKTRCICIIATAASFKNMPILRLFPNLNPFYILPVTIRSPFQRALRSGFVDGIRFFLSKASEYASFVDLNQAVVEDALYGCHNIKSAEPLQALLCSNFLVDANFKDLKEKEHSPHPPIYRVLIIEYLHQAERFRMHYRTRAVHRVNLRCPLLPPLCTIILQYAALEDLVKTKILR